MHLHGKFAVRHLVADAWQFVLGQVEEHRHGIKLRDHDDAARIRGVHHIARIDQTHARDPVDRRGDARIVEIQPRTLDGRLVDTNRAFGLTGDGLIAIELLLSNEFLSHQIPIALHHEIRVLQLGAVARQRALGLVQLNLERPRVDLGQHLALAHGLTLAEQDLHQAAVHLGPDGHSLVGHNVANAFQVDRNVAPDHSGGQHRHRTRHAWLDRCARLARTARRCHAKNRKQSPRRHREPAGLIWSEQPGDKRCIQENSQLSPINTSAKRANRPIPLGSYPTQPVCQRAKLAPEHPQISSFDCATQASSAASRCLSPRSSPSRCIGHPASPASACPRTP